MVHIRVMCGVVVDVVRGLSPCCVFLLYITYFPSRFRDALRNKRGRSVGSQEMGEHVVGCMSHRMYVCGIESIFAIDGLGVWVWMCARVLRFFVVS